MWKSLPAVMRAGLRIRFLQSTDDRITQSGTQSFRTLDQIGNFVIFLPAARKKIVPVQIEVIPSSDSALEAFLASVCVESALMQSNLEINSGNILVTIQTRNGLNIRKGNLDYRGLKILVEKLEAYVDDFRFEEFLLSS